MRKILLLLIMLDALETIGQSYTPMPLDSGNNWTDFITQRCENIQYFISGDTVIGTIYYKKLNMIAERYSSSGWPCNNGTAIYHRAFFRNDKAPKKVWMLYPSIANQELLLYDFNLRIGDTIQPEVWRITKGIYSVGNYDLQVIDSIDYINIGGNLHKRYISLATDQVVRISH